MARQRCGRLVRSPAPDCPSIISVDPVPVDLTVLGRKRWGGGGLIKDWRGWRRSHTERGERGGVTAGK